MPSLFDITVGLPYAIVIHFGMVVWAVDFIVWIYRGDLSVRITHVKTIFSLIGGGFGVFFMLIEHSWQREMSLLFLADLPALGVAELTSGRGWNVIFWYAFFGFLGGWGFGQFIDWIKNRQGYGKS